MGIYSHSASSSPGGQSGGFDIQANIIARAEVASAEKRLDELEKSAQRLGDELNKDANTVENRLTKALQDLGRQKGLQLIAEDAARSGASLSELSVFLEDIGANDKEVDKVAQAFARVNQEIIETNQLLDKTRKQELSQFRTEGRAQSFAVQQVTAVLPGGGGDVGRAATEAFNLLDTLPKLALSLSLLKDSVLANLAAIGAPGIALIGASLALVAIWNEVQKAQELVRISAERYAKSEIERARQTVTIQELLDSGNRQEAENRLRLINEERERSLNTLAQAESAKAEIEARLLAANQELASGGGADAAARRRQALADLEEFNKQFDPLLDSFDELNGKFITTADLLGLSGQALDEFLDISPEYVAELERQAEAQRRLNDSLINSRKALYEQIAGNTLTVESVNSRIEALNNEVDVINNLINNYDVSQELADQYNTRLIEINHELEILNNQSLERARQLDNERERLKAITDAQKEGERRAAEYAKNLERAGDAFKKLDKDLENLIRRSDKDLLKIDKTFAKAMERVEDTLAKGIVRANDQANKAIDKANTKSESDLTKALETRNKAILKLEDDLSKQREKVIKDSGKAEFEAIASRDVVAARRIREQRESQLSELDDKEKEQRELIASRYDEQIITINNSLMEQINSIRQAQKEQLNTVRANYEEQKNTAIANAEEQRKEVAARLDEETTLRRAAYAEQIKELGLFNEQALTLVRNFAQGAVGILSMMQPGLGGLLGGRTTNYSNSNQISPTLNINNNNTSGGLNPQNIQQVRNTVNNVINHLLTAAANRAGVNTRNVSFSP